MTILKRDSIQYDDHKLNFQEGKDLNSNFSYTKPKDTIPTIIKGANINNTINLTPLKDDSSFEQKSSISDSSTDLSKSPEISADINQTSSESKSDELLSTPVIDQKALDKEVNKMKAISRTEANDYKNQLFANIEQEKQAILKKAYQEGLEIAKKEADQALAEKSAEVLQTIGSAITEKNKILKKARGEILRLALKVAEQILKSEISLNQAVCVNIVAEAISRVTDKDKVIIRVNRSDVDFVKMNKDRFLKQTGDIKNLIIQEDSRVDQGGCIIETDLGYIDATIATQMETIEKALFKVYEEETQEADKKSAKPASEIEISDSQGE